jgi:hypothetical protein
MAKLELQRAGIFRLGTSLALSGLNDGSTVSASPARR